ncbi:MAG: helix-turn-helix transcriptional regulator [Eubacterium limosum]|nr:helix-turn-helix transcriptional regulator [Eubacterium limosum]
MTLGEKIRLLRNRNFLTQAKLAEKAGISLNSIQKYESGKNTPKIENLSKIATALKIDLDTLIEDTDYQKHVLPNLDTQNFLDELNYRMKNIADFLATAAIQTDIPLPESFNKNREELNKLVNESLLENAIKKADLNLEQIDEISRILSKLNDKGIEEILHYLKILEKVSEYQRE